MMNPTEMTDTTDEIKNILVTGAAGFIGAAVSARLLEQGYAVYGIDCINDYYPAAIKFGRLGELGISGEDASEWKGECVSDRYPGFRFRRMKLEDAEGIDRLFDDNSFDCVINLAAQAGVRYSIENPRAYIESNVCGFVNVLEGCRRRGVKHLLYASSSSVYGLNADTPFSEKESIAHPVSIYAATKKSDELMAHAYSHLFGIPCTGLRLFTVYGPWGRPDMSPFLFMDAILHDRPIRVFNNGEMWRDFTYIDDIVECIVRLVTRPPRPNPDWDAEKHDPSCSSAPYRIFNIGNHNPVRLMDYISSIENAIGREARKEMLPMQPGDVLSTCADCSALAETIGFTPRTGLQEGIDRTVKWFREFFHL